MTPNATGVGPWTDEEDCDECGADDEKVRGVTDGTDVRHLCWECFVEHTGEGSAGGDEIVDAANATVYSTGEEEILDEMAADGDEDDTAAVSWRDVT